MFKQKIKNMLKVVIKAFYPRFSCYGCSREMENPEDCLCEHCKKIMVRLEGNLCLKCGEPILEPTRICDNCRKTGEDIKYNAARASFVYDECSSKVVAGLKYNGKKYVASFMAREMVKTMESFGELPDILIPAPISKKRFKKRGYNQSELLANEINKLIGNKAEVCTDLVVRVKEVKPQVGLKRKEREVNLDGVFKLTRLPSLEGKVVFIVDDVYTTGTTSNEIARKLRRLHPKAIFVLTFAKSISPETKFISELTK